MPNDVVQHLRERRDAVGGARRVRNDVVLRRVVVAVVDAEHDGHVRVGGRRGDDDLARARGQVLRGVFALGEPAGRFEDDVDADILPRQQRRILLREDLELIAADLDRVAGRAHRHRQVAEHRVVLQQVRQRRRVGDVVDGDDVDVVMRERRAQDVAADPSEPVDANPNGHMSAFLRDPTNANCTTARPNICDKCDCTCRAASTKPNVCRYNS